MAAHLSLPVGAVPHLPTGPPSIRLRPSPGCDRTLFWCLRYHGASSETAGSEVGCSATLKDHPLSPWKSSPLDQCSSRHLQEPPLRE